MSLLAELQRRNMFRVAAGYAVAAWLLVQIAATLLPMFEAPLWIARALVIALAVGAVPVLALAWLYEWTPQGLKTQGEADAEGLSSRLQGARLNIALGLMLVAAMALFGLGRYSASPDGDATVHDASIAVLPFVNMSADKDNEYFSDGLSETLLNMLAQVPELKVAGRTSSFAFKGKNEDLRKIAAALGVAHVLEGSVQKSGDKVRVTAQLIAAGDGSHRWSQSYDRKLDDVFKIQDEIANEVVGALKLALTGDQRERLTQKRTDNVAAYQEYLKGMALLPKRKVSELREAAAHFERALELDPGFARAYVGAADSYLLLGDYDRRDDAESARTKRYIERALELAPNLGEAHASLAYYLIRLGNLERVEPELKRAIELAPSHASSYQWYSAYLSQAPGRIEEALILAERAAVLEPLSPIIRYNLAYRQAAAGRVEQGRATIARLVRDFPDYPTGQRVLAQIAVGTGDLSAALRAMQAYDKLDPDSINNRLVRCQMLLEFGAIAPADACVASFERMAPKHESVQEQLAVNALFHGDSARALALIESVPEVNPFVRVVILFKGGRIDDALRLLQTRFPEYFREPVPELGRDQQRLFALLCASVLRESGQPERAAALARRVLAASAKPDAELVPDFAWYDALAHALLGEREAATRALEEGVAKGAFVGLVYLDQDALRSDLRDDPRYERIVAPARARAAEQVRLAQAAGLL